MGQVMKPSSHPKTGTLTALASQYRPKERPVFESEPVELGPPPVDRDWSRAHKEKDVDLGRSGRSKPS